MVEISTSFTLPPAIRRSLRCGEADDTIVEDEGTGTTTGTTRTTEQPNRSSAPSHQQQHHHHPQGPQQPAGGFQPSDRVKSFVNGIVSPFTACWQPSLNQCGVGTPASGGGGGVFGNPCGPMNCGGPSSSLSDRLFTRQPAVVISPPKGSRQHHGGDVPGDGRRPSPPPEENQHHVLSPPHHPQPPPPPPHPYAYHQQHYQPHRQYPPDHHHHHLSHRAYPSYGHQEHHQNQPHRHHQHYHDHMQQSSGDTPTSPRHAADHHQHGTPASPVSTEVGVERYEQSSIGNRSHQQHQAPNATDNIEKPGTNDVLCGRGGSSNRHLGNIHFRELVAANKKTYNTLTKKQKMMIARKIVDAVHGTYPPGRFLAKDLDTGLFYDIGLPRSLEKTSQALREKNSNADSCADDEEGIETTVESHNSVIVKSADGSSQQQAAGESASATVLPLPKRSGKNIEAPPLTIPPHLVSVFGPKQQSASPKSEQPTWGADYPSPATRHPAASGPGYPPRYDQIYHQYHPSSPSDSTYGHRPYHYRSYPPPPESPSSLQTNPNPASPRYGESPGSSYHGQSPKSSSYYGFDPRYGRPPPQHYRNASGDAGHYHPQHDGRRLSYEQTHQDGPYSPQLAARSITADNGSAHLEGREGVVASDHHGSTPSSPPRGSPRTVRDSPKQGPSAHLPPSHHHPQHHREGSGPGGHQYEHGPHPNYHHPGGRYPGQPTYPGYDSPRDRHYYHSSHHQQHPNQHAHPQHQPSPTAPVLYRTPSNGYVRGSVDISPGRTRDMKRQRSDSTSNHNNSSFVSSSDVSLSSAVRESLTLKDHHSGRSERETILEGSEAGAASVALSNVSGASSGAGAWASSTSGPTVTPDLKSPTMFLQGRVGSRRGMKNMMDGRGPSTSFTSSSSSPSRRGNDPIDEEKKEGDLSFSGLSGLAALSTAAFLKLDEVK